MAREFYYAESTGVSTTTSATAQDKVTLTYTPPFTTLGSQKNYYYIWSCGITYSLNGGGTSRQGQSLLVNTTSATTLATCNSGDHKNTDYDSRGGIAFDSFSGGTTSAQTVKIQFDSLTAGDTTSIKQAALLVLRKGPNDVDVNANSSGTDFTTASTSLTDLTGATITVGAGTWLIFASAEWDDSASTGVVQLVLTDGTTNWGLQKYSPANTSTTLSGSWCHAVQVSPGGSTTYKIQVATSSGTAHFRNTRLIALNVEDLPAVYYQEDRAAATTTSTSPTDRSTLTQYTPAVNHFAFAVSCLSNDTSGNTSANRAQWDDSRDGAIVNQRDGTNTTAGGTPPANILAAWGVSQFTFTTAAHTLKTQFNVVSGGAATVRILDSAIIVVQLDDAPIVDYGLKINQSVNRASVF